MHNALRDAGIEPELNYMYCLALFSQQDKRQPILIYMTNAIPKGFCLSTVFACYFTVQDLIRQK
jgi:hypothetical protein